MATITISYIKTRQIFDSRGNPTVERVPIRSILGRPDGGAGLAGQKVVVGGWVKTGREQGKGSFSFLELSDGTYPANLQVIFDSSVAPLAGLVHIDTCVLAEGELKKLPEQKVELKVSKVLEVDPVDPAKDPIPKTRLTLEFLRDFVHLRPRTNTISAVARIRIELAYATHIFFLNHGFLYIHTPIITISDCEGAGEMFQVKTLINHVEKLERELRENPPPTEDDVQASQSVVEQKEPPTEDDVQASQSVVEQKAVVVNQLKADKASKEEIGAAVSVHKQAKEDLKRLEDRAKLKLVVSLYCYLLKCYG